jgi:hypothetical protein
MINARCETLDRKPSFKQLFGTRRCLVPGDGFYEWQHEGKGKVPMRVRMKDQRLFTFAGLWDVFLNSQPGRPNRRAMIAAMPRSRRDWNSQPKAICNARPITDTLRRFENSQNVEMSGSIQVVCGMDELARDRHNNWTYPFSRSRKSIWSFLRKIRSFGERKRAATPSQRRKERRSSWEFRGRGQLY